MSLDLLLSGGGFRATLFHLGVLRYLYEHRLDDDSKRSGLDELNQLVSVSGGSITACHFVANAKAYKANFQQPASKLIDFIRSTDVRRAALTGKRAVPELLDELFPEEFLLNSIPTTGLKLSILGTALKTGGCVAFSETGIEVLNNNEQSGELEQRSGTDVKRLYIQHAITASAAFPPVFPPLKIDASCFAGEVTKKELGQLQSLLVADGGIRDNLGLEYYLAKCEDSGNRCIICDAGQEFDWSDDDLSQQNISSWAKRALRTTEIQMSRIATLDRRFLLLRQSAKVAADPAGSNVQTPFAPETSSDAESRFATLSILDYRTAAPPQTDSGLARWNQRLNKKSASQIAHLPTDLTALQPGQVYALMRLGYDVAEHQLQFDQRDASDIPDDKFWQEYFPKAAMGDQAPRLADLLDSEKKNTIVIRDTRDAVAHIPEPYVLTPVKAMIMSRWIASLTVFAFAAIAVCAVWGAMNLAALLPQSTGKSFVETAVLKECNVNQYALLTNHLEAIAPKRVEGQTYFTNWCTDLKPGYRITASTEKLSNIQAFLVENHLDAGSPNYATVAHLPRQSEDNQYSWQLVAGTDDSLLIFSVPTSLGTAKLQANLNYEPKP